MHWVHFALAQKPLKTSRSLSEILVDLSLMSLFVLNVTEPIR